MNKIKSVTSCNLFILNYIPFYITIILFIYHIILCNNKYMYKNINHNVYVIVYTIFFPLSEIFIINKILRTLLLLFKSRMQLKNNCHLDSSH